MTNDHEVSIFISCEVIFEEKINNTKDTYTKHKLFTSEFYGSFTFTPLKAINFNRIDLKC